MHLNAVSRQKKGKLSQAVKFLRNKILDYLVSFFAETAAFFEQTKMWSSFLIFFCSALKYLRETSLGIDILSWHGNLNLSWWVVHNVLCIFPNNYLHYWLVSAYYTDFSLKKDTGCDICK